MGSFTTNRRETVETELASRAARFAEQSRLVVDYYRIRRKVAYALPVTGCDPPGMPSGLGARYPWATWLTWVLEDRINALGWSAHWWGVDDHANLVRRDLEALLGWPRFTQRGSPELAFAHAVRMLAVACASWPWLGDELRGRAAAVCAEAASVHEGWSEELYGIYDERQRIEAPDPDVSPRAMANIPLIGAIGLALAAHVAGAPTAGPLTRRALNAVLAMLDRRRFGHGEGVAYDGYVMDFVAELLPRAEPAQRDAVLEHEQTAALLDESLALAAPGHAMRVAQIGDVEPREMPFHASAHAKLAAMRPRPRSLWYLERCPVSWLRVDALAAQRDLAVQADAAHPPEPGALDAHYAVVLRSGWEEGDVAVAAAASRSRMGHLPPDAGTLVIATRGRWLIDDPGYQQYLPTSEREFAIGPRAHNAPVVNGWAPSVPGVAACVERGTLATGRWRTTIDTTHAYAPHVGLHRARRTVWLVERRLVVVADELHGDALDEVRYHWHGEPTAAWAVEDGHALIHCEPTTLWITCPGKPLGAWQVDRLRGSRGHLTLTAHFDLRRASRAVCWWVFTLDRAPAAVDPAPVEQTTRSLTVAGESFTLSDAASA